MASQDPTLADYFAVLRRRRLPAAVVGAAIVLGFIYFAYSLPAVYEAEAVIVVEQLGLTTGIVDQNPTYPEQRIQEVRQRVMTVDNLTRIIDELGLYPDRRELEPIDNLIAQFRADTIVAPESASIVNRNSGRVTQATFAFSLVFRYNDRIVVREVADQLAALFLEENDRMGVEQSADTAAFLGTEVKRLEAQVADIEAELAQFKAENSGALPENVTFNLETMARLERELTDLDRRLRVAREQRALLQTELVQTPRYAPLTTSDGEVVMSGADRLLALQQQLATLLGRYSETHPDVVNLRREIAALTGGSTAADPSAALRAELAAREAELAAARERYADTHPDVVSLQRTVDTLRARIAAAPAATSSSSQPNNPLYLQLQTRIRAADEEIQAINAARADLAARLETFRGSLSRAPEVERRYSDLMRRYDVSVNEYRQLRERQRQAELAQSLEAGGHRGEVFRIIEPPRIPTSPVSPNRISLVFLGIVVALASALVVVALAEGLDSTVRGQKDLRTILEMPPLAIIPFIENHDDQRKRRVRHLALAAGFAGAVCFVVLSILLQGQ